MWDENSFDAITQRATEQARHSAYQQQLVDTLVASAVDADPARAVEQARATQYAEDLQKALNNLVANHEEKEKGKTPMEVEGNGKGKAPVEVFDDDDKW